MGMSRGFHVFKILLRVRFRFPVHPSVPRSSLGSCSNRTFVCLHGTGFMSWDALQGRSDSSSALVFLVL